ncbi:hypothetical protein [uncultured Faecalibaculum sp.]|uniref:hypothetical protein n=1 Tax=uncultured Faecalibaculum sp. TaxID=1729681 RepID=UPI00272E6013|nr:hypothetical protein [uncultured Faecalibaculum sp.]
MVHGELRLFQLFPNDPVFQLRLSAFQLKQPLLGLRGENALLDGFKYVLHLRGHLPVFGLQRHQERFVCGVLFQ